VPKTGAGIFPLDSTHITNISKLGAILILLKILGTFQYLIEILRIVDLN